LCYRHDDRIREKKTEGENRGGKTRKGERPRKEDQRDVETGEGRVPGMLKVGGTGSGVLTQEVKEKSTVPNPDQGKKGKLEIRRSKTPNKR